MGAKTPNTRVLAVLVLWLIRVRCPDAAHADLWSMTTAALQAALDHREEV